MTSEQILQRFFDSLVTEIQGNMVKADANATGKTSRSLRTAVSSQRGTLYGARAFNLPDLPSPSGLASIEIGSPPGTRIPLKDLIEWAEARGIPLGVVGRIQRAIFQRGTVTVNELRPRNIYSKLLTRERLNVLYKDLGNVQKQRVVSEILRTFKTAA